MKPRKAILAATLMLAAFLGLSLAATTAKEPAPATGPNRFEMPAAQGGIDRATVALPPECVTKTRLARISAGWLPRAWVFVANFEVPDTACMLVYDRDDPNLVQGYTSLPGACASLGTLQINAGRATFDGGGWMRCNVNIMEAVNAISGSITLTDTAVINGFYMLGRGTLSPTVAISPADSNLIVGYVPTNTLRQPIGLYTPITETGAITRALIYSEFNGSAKYKPDCAFTVRTQDQRFAMTRDNFDTKYWLNGYMKCDWQPFPKIDLAQDGGVFFIGGTPWGKRLLGTLEEVIVDPFDGGEPPALLAGEDEDGQWRARLPVVVAP
jgi:hypothetical protein